MESHIHLSRAREQHWLRSLPHLRSMACGVFCFAVALPVVALGQTPRVSITGGADLSGKTYSWVVTNEHRSPIVSVEFPHYHGSLFFAPDGWDTVCSYLVNVGVADVSGSCKASVDVAKDGVRQGQRQTFRLRMDARGARRGRGDVRVRFADATEMVVAGVEVPQLEERAEKYMPLFGLVAMLMVVVLVRRRRAHSKTPASSG